MIIHVCDRCKKALNMEDYFMIKGVELCNECGDEFEKTVYSFVGAQEPQETHEESQEEAEKPKAKEKAAKKKEEPKKAKIDWDKACACKLAGWSNKDIALEIGASEGSVGTLIGKKLVEYKKVRGIA